MKGQNHEVRIGLGVERNETKRDETSRMENERDQRDEEQQLDLPAVATWAQEDFRKLVGMQQQEPTSYQI